MTSSFQTKQVYKSRAEAYRLFIRPQYGRKVGQTKFYNDTERLRMISDDGKSIELSALLGYVREELQLDPTTGQSMIERDHSKEMQELDHTERRLKIAKLQREEEKALGRTIDIEAAEQTMAKKIIIIYEKIMAQFRRDQEQACLRLGLPPAKASAYVTEATGTIDRAFNEMRIRKTFEIMIRGEDDRADTA